jgi:hypothetical protein
MAGVWLVLLCSILGSGSIGPAEGFNPVRYQGMPTFTLVGIPSS